MGGTIDHIRNGPDIHVLRYPTLALVTLISSILEVCFSQTHYLWTAQALASVPFREVTWKNKS